jgi:hypothetical protein
MTRSDAPGARVKQKARLKREAPRRSGPIRNVTMAFRAGAAKVEAPEPATPPVSAAAKYGVVEHAVEVAYRVFDDYMKRGREAAHRARPPEETYDPMNNDRRDPASMAMQYWANMAQMWFGYMAPFMPPGMPGMNRGGWDMGGNCGPEHNEHRRHDHHRHDEHRHHDDEKLAIAVEVTSEKPAQVTVKLHDKRHIRHLEVRRLLPAHGDGPPLTSVHFDEVDGHLRVRVSVPTDFPDGLYEGMIHSRENGTLQGTLQVVIGHRRP